MTHPKHLSHLHTMTLRAQRMPERPEDVDAVLPRAEEFVPFAAWMLMCFRSHPALQSIVLHAHLHVDKKVSAPDRAPVGVDLHTEIGLVTQGAQLFATEDEKAQLILDLLPGTRMSRGSFVLDRSAPELEMLDAWGPRDTLDVECTVYRLAQRMSYEVSRVRIRRSFGLGRPDGASGTDRPAIAAAGCAPPVSPGAPATPQRGDA